MKGSYNDIIKALVKKAGGYTVNECVEEYSDGDTLCKRKITKKHMPPDVAALKVLLELNGAGGDTSVMSDEELEQEKQRLIALLKNYEEGEDNKTITEE